MMAIQTKFPGQINKLQVGDKVRWFRRSAGSLNGTVLKFTPKRVQILVEMPDGRSKIRYVTARKLVRLVPGNENSRQPLIVEVLSKDHQRELNRIGLTVAGQIVSGLGSLILGGVCIAVITALGRELLIDYGSRAKLFGAAIISSLGLIILTISVIQKQYDEGLTSDETFRAALRHAVRGLFIAISLIGFAIVSALVMQRISINDFQWLIVETVFMAVDFLAIALVIGGIQHWRLEVENFDVTTHHLLLSNNGAVTASQFGIMPYRAKVREFWTFIMYALVTPIYWGSFAILWHEGAVWGGMFMFAVSLLFTVMLWQSFAFIFKAHLDSLETYVAEKHSQPAKGLYFLVCKADVFTTDARTWQSIRPGQKYLLWYAPMWFAGAKNRVVAAEPGSSF